MDGITNGVMRVASGIMRRGDPPAASDGEDVDSMVSINFEEGLDPASEDHSVPDEHSGNARAEPVNVAHLKWPIFKGKKTQWVVFKMKFLAVARRHGMDLRKIKSITPDQSMILADVLMTCLDDTNVRAYQRYADRGDLLWQALSRKYERVSHADIAQIKAQLRDCRLTSPARADEYIGKINALLAQLEEAGGALSDGDRVAYLLGGLPASYDFSAQISYDPGLRMKPEKVSAMILDHRPVSMLTTRSESNSAEHAKGGGRGPRRQKKKAMKCFHCGGPHPVRLCKVPCPKCGKCGHTPAFCSVREANHTQTDPTSQNLMTSISSGEVNGDLGEVPESGKSQNFVTSEANIAISGSAHRVTWIVDSGCTQHMTPERRAFRTYQAFRGVVKVANGMTTHAIGRGDVCIEDGETCMFLRDVWHVPSLHRSLLSVEGLLRAGYDVSLSHSGSTITGQDGSTMPLSSHADLLVVHQLVHVPECNLAVGIDTWHRRLGHQSSAMITKLKDVVQGLDIGPPPAKSQPRLCIPCQEAKAKRLPMPSGQHRRSLLPHELVYVDMTGPVTPSTPQGHKYAVVYEDDCTAEVQVFLVRKKSDVPATLRWYKRRTGAQPKAIQCDNAPDLIAGEFGRYCRKKGVRIRPTLPYRPQQNRVEKKIDLLLTLVRSMLFDARMPESCWGWAALAAQKIFAVSLTKGNGGERTPQQMRTLLPPDVSNLRVWGCQVAIQIPRERRRDSSTSKHLSKRGALGIFIGYDPAHGYKILGLDGKIVRTRDVIFDENLPGGDLVTDEHPALLKLLFNGVPTTRVDTEPATRPEEDTEPATRPEDEDDAADVTAEDPTDTPVVEVELETVDKGMQATDEGYGSETTGAVEEETTGAVEEETTDAIEEENNDSLTAMPSVEETADEGKMSHNFIVTRSGRPVRPPKRFGNAAETDYEAREWQDARRRELDTLKDQKTWEVVPVPTGRKLIETRWVYSTKPWENGDKYYKARFVAKGYSQIKGIDYGAVFAPTVPLDNFRLLAATLPEYFLGHVDIKGAYLHADIDEEVYLRAPAELNVPDGHCLRLRKSLYGLKQAGRNWYLHISATLESKGWTQLQSTSCVFVNKEREMLTLHGDDLGAYFKSEKRFNDFVKNLKKQYVVGFAGPLDRYLGIYQGSPADGTGLALRQEEYARECLERFAMSEANAQATPMVDRLAPRAEGEETADVPYRELIGSLIYLVTGSRPDLACAVSELAAHMSAPTLAHWQAAKRALRYLKGTADYGLVINADVAARAQKSRHATIEAFCDSDWAGDKEKRRSRMGFIIFVNGFPVTWKSTKQDVVALSSAAAEYIAMSECAREIMGLCNVLIESGLRFETPVLKIDNRSAEIIANGQSTGAGVKHIDIRYHHVKQLIKEGKLRVEHVASADNIADIFTKPLGRVLFCKHRDSLVRRSVGNG